MRWCAQRCGGRATAGGAVVIGPRQGEYVRQIEVAGFVGAHRVGGLRWALAAGPDVPKKVASQAQVELAGGIPFLSDKDLQAQLGKAGVPAQTADAIVAENASARIDGLRSSLSLLAVIALIALFATRRLPAKQPSASPDSEPAA